MIDSQKYFSTIFDLSPMGIEIYDSKGVLVDVNHCALDIFGVKSVDDVKGFNLFDDPNVDDRVKDVLHEGEAVRYESKFDFGKVKKMKLYETSKSGFCYLDVFIIPVDKGKGGYIVQLQDVTPQKKISDDLFKSNKKYKELFELSSDGILLVDSNNQMIIDSNVTASEILGVSKAELRTNKCCEILCKNHVDEKCVLESILSDKYGEISDEEHCVKDKSGNDVFISINAVRFVSEGEDMVLVSMRDITNRKGFEVELKEKIEELKKINKLMVDREEKMIELKREIAELKKIVDVKGTSDNSVGGGDTDNSESDQV